MKGDEGTNAQKALRYGLSNCDISTIIIGLEKISHLKDALDVFKFESLDSEMINKINNLQQNNFK